MATTQEQLKNLYDSKLELKKSQLAQSYNNAISNLDAQQKANAEQTRQNIGIAKTNNDRAAVNNAEYYAAAGLASGPKMQAELARENQIQADVAAMRADQQKADAEADRQRVMLGHNYQEAIRQAKMENDIARAESLYEQAGQIEAVTPFEEARQNMHDYASKIAQTVLEPERQKQLIQAQLQNYVKAGTMTPAQAQAWQRLYFTGVDEELRQETARIAQTVSDPKRRDQLIRDAIAKYVESGWMSQAQADDWYRQNYYKQ